MTGVVKMTAVARMSLFKPVFIDHRVTLEPREYREAYTDIDAYLTKKIRRQLEDQCCTHGYVRPGSTQILARSMGLAENGRFTGDFLYTCKVKLMCLLPYDNQLMDARVAKVNRMGAYVLLVDEGKLREAIRILLPRDLQLGNAEFDALKPGDGVKARILRARFQTNDSYINATGLFEGLQPSASGPVESLVPAVEDTEAIVPPAAGGNSAAAAAVLSPIVEGSHESASEGTQGTPEELKAAKAVMRAAFAPKAAEESKEAAGVEESKEEPVLSAGVEESKGDN
jgi:DNA-directed RNA polymerase subunit E'/Rpb7